MRLYCALCLSNLRMRGNFVGHRGYHPRRRRYIPWRIEPLKRPTEAQEKSSAAHGLSDAQFVGKYPTILAYLTDDVWDDGKAREVSALSWSVKDGSWQLALNDKALKQSLYTAGPTMNEALKLMETCLSSGTGSWRSWKRGK